MFTFKKGLTMPSPAEALPGRPSPIPTAREHFIFDKEMLMAIPGADGTFETRNPRHEPGDATHPGIDREHH